MGPGPEGMDGELRARTKEVSGVPSPRVLARPWEGCSFASLALDTFLVSPKSWLWGLGGQGRGHQVTRGFKIVAEEFIPFILYFYLT